MVSILSPGVYLIEKDLSIYPASIGATTVGIVGFATKGPTNRATLITSPENLIKIFGQPEASLEGQGLVGALEILETTNSLYYVRACAESEAKSASAVLGLGACPAIGIKAGSYGKDVSAALVIQVWDNQGTPQFTGNGKLFVIPSGVAATQQAALARVIGQDVDTLKVTCQFPYTTDNNGSIVPGSLGGEAGIIVGSFAGNAAKLSVSASVDDILYAFDNTDGTIDPAVTTGDNLTVSGFGIQTSSLAYRVESLYPGTGYNEVSQPDGSVRGNSLRVTPLGGPKFTVVVNEDGGSYETFTASLVNKDGLFLTDVINTGVENATSEVIKGNFYSSGTLLSTPTRLTSFVDQVSSIAGSRVGTQYGTADVEEGGAPRFVKLIQYANKALAGGSNGLSSGLYDWKEVINGDAAEKTGLYALDDDILNLTVALVPGVHDDNVQNALITLAEQTGNFLAVVSPPIGLNSVQEAIDWSNGFGGSTRSSAINSSYAAIYWPYVQTYVPALGKDDWIDPAVYGARQIVYTASVSELWFAAAGFIRGRLTKPTAVEVQLGQGDRDAMYSGGNAINPIVNFPQQGITIFGQRTAQRNPTALDRINVRLLSIFLKKTLLASVRSLIFEPNDPILWEQITDITTGILTDIKNRRGITSFQVICDETTNTPVRVDRNELWCKVVIQPTKTAEAIVFELNLTSQSGTVN